MPSPISPSKSESERKYRVVDQSLTMHALLRDRYYRRALILNTAQIGLSLFLCAFAFIPDSVFASFRLEPSNVRFAFGITAVTVLLVAITEYRVDWRSAGALHDTAVRELSVIKGKLRRSSLDSTDNRLAENKLTMEYERTMENVPPVPERYFLRLKSRHEYKRALSKAVSDNPSSPLWLTRLRLRWLGTRLGFHEEKPAPGGKELT